MTDTSQLPDFIYGTAWKEAVTEYLVRLAIEKGFTAIDTANQRKHYNEEAVGNAISSVIKDGIKGREELFIQTKFTYQQGQDHRLPYEPEADYPTQVRQSFSSSLEHLQTDYLDSYILHGPLYRHGISEADRQVWGEMEKLHKDGYIRHIGVSNISLAQLRELVHTAEIKPAFVQNRCFAKLQWDKAIREFCKEQGIVYQGFSLLTANAFVFSDPMVIRIAKEKKMTLPQLVFSFAAQAGILPLTGTTNPVHMAQDLDSRNFSLSDGEVRYLEGIAFQGR
ncbi:MAG: aldo/keto reductase [Desulfococcaceae bacterium]|jgi:diketogulonate reductase-like aldo/keto reductase|nr:aldo/keto reductase [Desulfococcaceae bacterium]